MQGMSRITFVIGHISAFMYVTMYWRYGVGWFQLPEPNLQIGYSDMDEIKTTPSIPSLRMYSETCL